VEFGRIGEYLQPKPNLQLAYEEGKEEIDKRCQGGKTILVQGGFHYFLGLFCFFSGGKSELMGEGERGSVWCWLVQ
jgi:hypothetical protein